MAFPPRNKRPKKTKHLIDFEMVIAEINEFFWLSLAGYFALKTLRPTKAKNTKDFLPIELANRQDLSLAELDAALTRQENRLSRLCLVEVVTFYEEYLKNLIYLTLRRIGVDKTKKPKLQIDLSKISSSESSESFITKIWLLQKTEEILAENYGKRPNRIDSALNIDIVKSGSQHGTNFEFVKIAGELRNCIVHTGGIVDKRTLKSCSCFISGLSLNQQIPLTKDILFNCLGALGNHAKDIDLMVRIKYGKSLTNKGR